MKKIFIILFMFSFFSKVIAGNNGTAYDYEFNSIDGDLIKLISVFAKEPEKLLQVDFSSISFFTVCFVRQV